MCGGFVLKMAQNFEHPTYDSVHKEQPPEQSETLRVAMKTWVVIRASQPGCREAAEMKALRVA